MKLKSIFSIISLSVFAMACGENFEAVYEGQMQANRVGGSCPSQYSSVIGARFDAEVVFNREGDSGTLTVQRLELLDGSAGQAGDDIAQIFRGTGYPVSVQNERELRGDSNLELSGRLQNNLRSSVDPDLVSEEELEEASIVQTFVDGRLSADKNTISNLVINLEMPFASAGVIQNCELELEAVDPGLAIVQ